MNTSAKSVKRFFAVSEEDDKSSNAHRQLIGYSGLILPVLLWLIAGWRPIEELQHWKPLSSVSAYYYTGSVSVFTGILVALGLFLFSYKGYGNQYQRSDRIAAIIAGIAAILVAFFPTGAPLDLKSFSWWTPLIGKIHICSAAVLFGSFIFFSLFLFTKSDPNQKEAIKRSKRIRNWIYIFCGAAMLVCMLWILVATINHTPIFWPEALALEFFAVSWLVKGRADITAVAISKWSLDYGHHPGKLFAKYRRRTTT
jgi:hypothetical protein